MKIDLEYIRGYYDRRKIVVNLGCLHGHHIGQFVHPVGEEGLR